TNQARSRQGPAQAAHRTRPFGSGRSPIRGMVLASRGSSQMRGPGLRAAGDGGVRMLQGRWAGGGPVTVAGVLAFVLSAGLGATGLVPGQHLDRGGAPG